MKREMQDLNDYFQEIVYLIDEEIHKDRQNDKIINQNNELINNNLLMKNEFRNKI